MSTVASNMIKDESKTLDDVGLLNEQRTMKETLPRNVAMFGAVF